MLVSWLYDLQMHQASCLQHLAEIIPPEQDPGKLLGKAAKPVTTLPVHSFRVKHLGLSQDDNRRFFRNFPGLVWSSPITRELIVLLHHSCLRKWSVSRTGRVSVPYLAQGVGGV